MTGIPRGLIEVNTNNDDEAYLEEVFADDDRRYSHELSRNLDPMIPVIFVSVTYNMHSILDKVTDLNLGLKWLIQFYQKSD